MRKELRKKCKLCGNIKPLANSHIIPEFLYKSLYDKKHRIFKIPSSKDSKIQILHKGFREKLLCFDCENELSKYEMYMKKLLYDDAIEICEELNNKEIFMVSGINYKKFKLFQLSVIWRASVAGITGFSEFKLGPHENNVQKMLASKYPGKYYEYGCLLMALIDKGELLDIISSPREIRMDGIRCFRIVFGGYAWIYAISSHNKKSPFKQFFLQENGILPIVKAQARDLEFLQKDSEYFREWEKDFDYFSQKYKEDI